MTVVVSWVAGPASDVEECTVPAIATPPMSRVPARHTDADGTLTVSWRCSIRTLTGRALIAHRDAPRSQTGDRVDPRNGAHLRVWPRISYMPW